MNKQLTLGELENLKKDLESDIGALISAFISKTFITNIEVEAGVRKEGDPEGRYVRSTVVVHSNIKI